MGNKVIFKIKNLNFAYIKNQYVLNIHNIELNSNELYLIRGRNGTGKTTFLKLLTGLLPCPPQTIFFKDECILKQKSILREKIIFVHEKPYIFKDSVFNNIAFGLKLKRFNKREITNKVFNLVNLLKFEKYLDRDAFSLSTGQKKLIGLLRAFVLEPEILILDEPDSNIDTDKKNFLIQFLEKIVSEDKSTVIFSSHSHYKNYNFIEEKSENRLQFKIYKFIR